MISFEIETANLRRNAEAVRRNTATAMEASVRAQGRLLVTHLLEKGPKRTNRLRRSYALAGNEAGVGPFVVPPIVRDPEEESIRELLLKQLTTAQRAFDWLDWQIRAAQREDASRGRNSRTGRMKARRMSQPYYKKIRQQRNWWRRRLEAAERAWVQFNQAQGTALVMNQLAGWREVGVGTSVTSVTKRAISVRHKVYGGSGKVITTANAAFVHLVSHEPHVRLVQRNMRFMTTALKTLSEPAVRRVSKRTFVRAAGEGTPWAAGKSQSGVSLLGSAAGPVVGRAA